jgi:molybdopterin/thiamine biosynthesis adenylyltransferase
MSVIRIPQAVWQRVHTHLYSRPGEHFAFMLARTCYSQGEPVFMVRDALLIPDDEVTFGRSGWVVSTESIICVVNAGVKNGDSLIEVHNHGGHDPRFSWTDRRELPEFVRYILDSLPGRPYAATVWGDSSVFGRYYLQKGRAGVVKRVTVIGDRLRQIVSRDDDGEELSSCFNRQLPWFTEDGQRAIGRMQVAIVGAGGIGSQLIQNLVYLGVADFVLVEAELVDATNMNRLVTARARDVGKSKLALARRLIKGVKPKASVRVVERRLQSTEALDALKGTDVIFGCVDNDGARLILNELALAYGIPYFDLAVGIDAEDGRVSVAGGRVTVVLPGEPCLHCMGEIDLDEARFYLSSKREQDFNIHHGYVRGMLVPSPSVVSLNAAIAAAAANEFAVFVSGVRNVNRYTELDLLGAARPHSSQWLTPRHVKPNPACIQCTVAEKEDSACIERYAIVAPAP